MKALLCLALLLLPSPQVPLMRSTQPGQKWIICYGDSKTALHATRGTFTTYLAALSPTTFRPAWTVFNGGVAGDSVARAVAALTTRISSAPTTTQAGSDVYVLLNWGVNDIGLAENVEATWKANYLILIDAYQARWPTAKIYLMRPWARGYTVPCNTMAGWIDDIVALRTNVFVGPDERTWLENGDDGATYTYDGTHYTGSIDAANGMALAAAQWKAIIWP